MKRKAIPITDAERIEHLARSMYGAHDITYSPLWRVRVAANEGFSVASGRAKTLRAAIDREIRKARKA